MNRTAVKFVGTNELLIELKSVRGGAKQNINVHNIIVNANWREHKIKEHLVRTRQRKFSASIEGLKKNRINTLYTGCSSCCGTIGGIKF